MASEPLNKGVVAALAITLLLAILGVGSMILPRSNGSGRITDEGVTVELGGESFTLTISADDESRERGLMGVTSIDLHGGMFFVFPDVERRGFWMKNCVVDMDILFLDSRGRITAAYGMFVEPPQGKFEDEIDYELRLASYDSLLPAQYVIEVQAGTIERLGIRQRDRVELPFEALKALVR